MTDLSLGGGGVGKSALIVQLISHQFLDYHDPTIEDAYQHQVVLDNEPALLDILDTAGQQEFTAMREQYMRNGEGFIIIYSITDRSSFNLAAQYKDQIERVRRTDDIPIVLVGNKDDLEGKREVTTQEGQELAHRFDCPFFETSACQRHFVDDAFHGLVREIRKKEKQRLTGHFQEEKKGLVKSLRNFVKRRGRKTVS
ncbi:predicted protein [Nematostella vectensis]|uniref:small monomeric GTPase n=1 Tax=Nematostella vectensis TaxID=45351 RepID=A7SIQ7_NEMVE|nr:predicted protein [Nematostella vectensis]|eukprot:XP_001628459.1 predicted protein [Nematostella vectensis]